MIFSRSHTALLAMVIETGDLYTKSTTSRLVSKVELPKNLVTTPKSAQFNLTFRSRGDTFVDTEAIRQEIAAGRYDLTDPLSTDNQAAIEASSLSESDDASSKFLGSRFAARRFREGLRRAQLSMDCGNRIHQSGGSATDEVNSKRRYNP